MRKLNYELKQLCLANREGSYGTQRERERTLTLIANQLDALGFKKMYARSLRPKHVERLVAVWKNGHAELGWKPVSIGWIRPCSSFPALASRTAMTGWRIALSVIEDVRGEDEEYVFTYRGRPVLRMMNSAWLRARKEAGLPQVRVHDLKHTFGRRLRAAGVSFEDRQDLLGHRAGRMTTHYSAAELSDLIEAAGKVCAREGAGKPELVVLRRIAAS